MLITFRLIKHVEGFESNYYSITSKSMSFLVLTTKQNLITNTNILKKYLFIICLEKKFKKVPVIRFLSYL